MITETNRWRGAVAFTLFAGAIGVLAQRPAVLLLAIVGVGFAAYPRLLSPPNPNLVVERAIDPETPERGEDVDVTVTVRNESDEWLPDLRIVDGVPPLLPVVDGSPRCATALEPGGETTVRYTVSAERGKHRFEPLIALVRDASGGRERRIETDDRTVIDCSHPVENTILRELTQWRTGTILTDDGGDGVEFHKTREYRPGDPANRVDWHRFARTRELTTVEFRQERAGSIVLCVDPVSSGPQAGTDATRYAVACGFGAAGRLATALVGDDHGVGIATLDHSTHWCPPKVGSTHLSELHEMLDTHPGLSQSTEAAYVSDGGTPHRSDGVESIASGDGFQAGLSDSGGAEGSVAANRYAAELSARLDENTQVLVVSPLFDDSVVRTAVSLESAGHPVSVVSPDTTGRETVGHRLATVERTNRIRTLRRMGIPVVDWDVSEELGTTIGRTAERTGSTARVATQVRNQ